MYKRHSMVLSLVDYICTYNFPIIDLAEYVLNKCITQAGEDQPVKYNFDCLEDQIPSDQHDNHTLVLMVRNGQWVEVACNKLIIVHCKEHLFMAQISGFMTISAKITQYTIDNMKALSHTQCNPIQKVV